MNIIYNTICAIKTKLVKNVIIELKKFTIQFVLLKPIIFCLYGTSISIYNTICAIKTEVGADWDYSRTTFTIQFVLLKH